MRALAALLTVVVLSAATMIAPEGPIVASSACGDDPHDPSGQHLDRDHAGDAGDDCGDDCGCGEDCSETSHCSCCHTHVRAIATALVLVPRVPFVVTAQAHAGAIDEGERDGFHTTPLRPPSA